jgi:hypothetical protein
MLLLVSFWKVHATHDHGTTVSLMDLGLPSLALFLPESEPESLLVNTAPKLLNFCLLNLELLPEVRLGTVEELAED